MAEKNKKKLLSILTEEPLTFTELIEKSKLSRAVVHKNLKSFENRGIIEKQYKNGKLLNILIPENIDIIEWFISQLRDYDIPEEVLKKGTQLLTKEILVTSAGAISGIQGVLIEVNNALTSSTKEEIEALNDETKILSFPAYSAKHKLEKFKPKFIYDGDYDERLEKNFVAYLSELNPFAFSIFLTLYYLLDRLSREGIMSLKKSNPTQFAKIEKIYPILYVTQKIELRKDLDKVVEWWNTEVANYLPSNTLFQLFAGVYVNGVNYLRKQMIENTDNSKK